HVAAAPVVDGGRAFVAGTELYPASDILGVAVGIASADGELLLGVGLEHGSRGEDFQAANLDILGGGRRRAGRDPFANHAIFERILGEAFASAVWDREIGRAHV